MSTTETSLQLLSEAVGNAADDFRAVRVVLDRAHGDIASRNNRRGGSGFRRASGTESPMSLYLTAARPIFTAHAPAA